MGYDIFKQAAADVASIHLKGLGGEHLYDDDGNKVGIVVYGPGSKAFAQMEAVQTARNVKRMNDNDGKLAVGSPEERAQERAEDLAAVTVRFENLDYSAAPGLDGIELFTAFYKDKRFGDITRQVVKALSDWGNFKAGSATS